MVYYYRPTLICMKAVVALLVVAATIFTFISYCYTSNGLNEGAKDQHEIRQSLYLNVDSRNSESNFPRMAWLMSYPNSGTSYTMQLIRVGGNRSVATNYGLEVAEKRAEKENVPLYSDSPNGPYILNRNANLPERYILTKTHCGGRCVDCGPEDYMEDEQSFLKRCAQGNRKDPTKFYEKEIVQYDPMLTQRAIHLIRNPFNNLVSNFHLERKNKRKRNHYDWLLRYPNNSTGFRDWCFDLDTKYLKREDQVLPMDVVEAFRREDVPCHAHFYRYAKWHEYTLQITKQLQLPTLTVYYEDYETTKFNKTATMIFEFLQLPQVNTAPPFQSGKSYDFFNKRESEAAMALVYNFVNNATWHLLERYMVGSII